MPGLEPADRRARWLQNRVQILTWVSRESGKALHHQQQPPEQADLD